MNPSDHWLSCICEHVGGFKLITWRYCSVLHEMQLKKFSWRIMHNLPLINSDDLHRVCRVGLLVQS